MRGGKAEEASCSRGEWDHLCLPLPKACSTLSELLSQGTRDKSSLDHDGSPGAQGHAAIVRHVIVIKEQTQEKKGEYILQAWEERGGGRELNFHCKWQRPLHP